MNKGLLHQQIRERAYLIWEREGRPSGREKIHWEEAKEELCKPKRKLASLVHVESKKPHENADTLEIVMVLGWQVVTKLGDTSVGDLVVYFEIDSLIDVNAQWLPDVIRVRAEKSGDTLFRIKTIKLRGELSQGLIVPLSSFNQKELDDCGILKEGLDLTEKLKVQKYDPPELGEGYIQGPPKKSTFPSHLVSKTDEIRVQSAPKLFKAIQNQPYRITLKYDGTSSTFVIDPDTREFLVCSRNQICPIPKDDKCPYHEVAKIYGIEKILRTYPEIAIQGEICGPKIQKNLLALESIDLFVFNVINIRTQKTLDIVEFCNTVGLRHVLIIDEGEKFQYPTINVLLTSAEGLYPGTRNEREGLVVRSVGLNDLISFKAISNRYLLKQ